MRTCRGELRSSRSVIGESRSVMIYCGFMTSDSRSGSGHGLEDVRDCTMCVVASSPGVFSYSLQQRGSQQHQVWSSFMAGQDWLVAVQARLRSYDRPKQALEGWQWPSTYS